MQLASSMFQRLAIVLLGIFVTYFAANEYQASLSPPADPDQYECHPGPNDPKHLSRPSPSPVVKVIRLTDSGELVRRCEWTDALYELTRVKQEKVVVLYVHGWRHNSDINNSDRKNFTSLITQLTERESKRTNPRHVVGIFVGWNATSGYDFLDFLTFWRRKQAADRISQSAVLTKLIGAIDNIKRVQNRQGDRFFILGHSFGARIVYSATVQLLLYSAERAYPPPGERLYSNIKGPSDLIVLLNPALESAVFTPVNRLRRNRKDGSHKEAFSKNQEPLMLLIAAQDDWAVRYGFPVGQWLGAGRDTRDLIGIGHYEEFTTHRLHKISKGKEGPAISSDWTQQFCSEKVCLRRMDQSQNNPFLVVQSEDVLQGHNGIWQPEFVSWLMRFLEKVDKRKTP